MPFIESDPHLTDYLWEEEIPDSYPEVPLTALAAPDFGPPAAWVWARIEAYCSWRWTPRVARLEVYNHSGWIRMPVRPFRVTKLEICNSSGQFWEWTELDISCAPQRGWNIYAPGLNTCIRGIAGENNPAPGAVIHAAVRLHTYLAHQPESFPLWATSKSHAQGDSNDGFQRPANYIAKAMQHSGAADLLRTYRRLR